MYKKILAKIKPSEKEQLEVSKIVEEFLNKINNKLINANAIVGGSFAKGTWLRNQHDIDIFVLFNSKENISLRLEVVIKSLFKDYEKIHGSRDYFIVNFKDLSFELVPVLKIDKAENAENITDVSPMHAGWVKKNVDEKLTDEIRIAKYFLKINNLYGAETYIGGFSGYLAELLVIHYGSFLNFLNSSLKWKLGHVVDIEQNSNFCSEQKFSLIVIDPVQPNRNAAAALREDKFDLFLDLARKYLAKPSTKFFKEKKINLNKYNLVLKLTPLGGSKDVAGTKMLKIFETIDQSLKVYGFEVKSSGWFWSDFGYLYFKLKNKTLSKTEKHYGPPTDFTKDIEKFKEKHKGYKIGEEKGKTFVILPRKFTKIKDLIKFILNDDQIKTKVKSIEITKF